MKKRLLGILFCGVLILQIVGCGKDKNLITLDELNTVNDSIIEYFQSDNVQYDNLNFNYVDTTNKKVVVGLFDNSKEQQDKFKKVVVDSKFIEFVKGEKLMNQNDYNKNDTTFKETCLENQLGGYITSEVIVPAEKSLNDIIKIDMTKISYSKVKITDNGLIYAIIKTNDNDIEKDIDNYFSKDYSGYQKTKFDNEYLVYVYNKNIDLNLDENLKVCLK